MRRALAAFLAVLFICSANAVAEKMNAQIQEAIYDFEMKGETAEAVRLLEKISREGDKEDRENAFFYLGKIKEISNSKNSANFYYQQSLNSTRDIDKAYWLSEREASTSTINDALISNKFALKSPIEKIFNNETTYLLLRNGIIKKVLADSIVDVRSDIPVKSNILKIDDFGIWYQTAEQDSIFFRPHNTKVPSKSYPVVATSEFFSKGDYAVAQNGSTLTLLNKKGVIAQIKETYNGCHVEDYYEPTRHYILNCNDNALHFVSGIDGVEAYTISQFDAVRKVLLDGNDVFLLSGNTLFSYRPKVSTNPLWKTAFSNAEEILSFNGNIVVLEASGRITLVDRETGLAKNSVRSDASSVYPLALGTLGLFSNEGDLIVVDTLLHPLWHFNFARPITAPPIHTENSIILVFEDAHLMSISAHYYGKKALLSDVLTVKAATMAEAGVWGEIAPLLDSLLKLEPGNAEAWLYRALLLEATGGSEKDRQKAWTEAVRLSVSTSHSSNVILNRYSKAIGAKFVSLLAVSPKTKYPQFFGHKKNIYTVDPAAERLICINAENGETRFMRNLPKMTDSPVMNSEENTLAIASGFALYIYDLDRDVAPQTLQLPGQAYSIKQTQNAIYIATWNGFLLKVTRSENRLAWSRKIYSSPFIFTPQESNIYAASLEGELKYIAEYSGQAGNFNPRLPGSVSHIAKADSSIALATDNNRIFLYSANDISKDPVQILMESPVVSLQVARDHESHNLLVGLADQSFLLYSSAGTPLWKYQGKNSIFGTPYIDGNYAWIDQGSEVIAISLKDGSVAHRFNTPGGAGTPFVMNKTLFSASSKRLLYGFSL